MTDHQKPVLQELRTPDDIPEQWRGSPLEKLILYHNFHEEYRDKIGPSSVPELVVGMCMDFRHRLKSPNNFAYIMRAAGANIINLDFMVSIAVGVGNVRHMAIIGHNDCAMDGLKQREELFIKGLVANAGWEESRAQEYFLRFEPTFATGNSAEYTVKQVAHYRKFFPQLTIAGLYYNLEDHKLWLIQNA